MNNARAAPQPPPARQQQQPQQQPSSRGGGGSAQMSARGGGSAQLSSRGGSARSSALGSAQSPRQGQLHLGNFTVEVEVPACFTDRSGCTTERGNKRDDDPLTTNSAFRPRQIGRPGGGLGGRPPALAALNAGNADIYDSPGFTENQEPGPKKLVVDADDLHTIGDPGKPLMPYGCCTPVGLVALGEVVRVLLPGGSSMETNAELQGIFGVLRLVQALFLSAPLLYFQVWTMMLIEFPKVMEHHIVVLVSAAISYLALVLALTGFVTSPAIDRACRVRGWLVSSKAVMMGTLLYFAADVALRALTVATVGYAAGGYAFLLPPMLLLVWMIHPLVDELGYLFSAHGLGGGFSPGLPLFAYREPPQNGGNGSGVAALASALFCCCRSHGCCVRPVRVWLDTALRYFAFVMAPPVLDGLGAEPRRLALETVVSTIVCAGLTFASIQPSMPHPQHDPVVIHFVLVVLATSVVLKLVTFVWVFFPSMTGLYPVVGVSLVQWCDCMNWREDAEGMEEDVNEGTRKFMERQQQRGSRGGRDARSMH